jgi:glutathione S-transferase
MLDDLALLKLPVLVDGDLVITESAAIVLYLADKYPQKELLPADFNVRAQVYRWVMFAMTELEPPLWRTTRHTTLLPVLGKKRLIVFQGALEWPRKLEREKLRFIAGGVFAASWRWPP